MEKVEPGQRVQPLSRRLALAAVVACGAAAPMQPNGVFCAPGKGARILAVAPGPAGALRFGLSIWTSQGQNISLFGTAGPIDGGWLYAPDATCRVSIKIKPDQAISVDGDPHADCHNEGGAGTMVGTLAFTQTAYEGPVSDQLDNVEAFQKAGRCVGGQ